MFGRASLPFVAFSLQDFKGTRTLMTAFALRLIQSFKRQMLGRISILLDIFPLVRGGDGSITSRATENKSG